jgi:hypothetical protein
MAKKQKVKFDRRGAYMTHYGKRIHLCEVIQDTNSEEERLRLAEKHNVHINDVAIGYYSNNYKVYLLGWPDAGDAVGMVEFISY